MEKFKECDAAIARGDEAALEVKKLTEELTDRDHEILSLKNRLQRAEEELEKADVRMAAAKIDIDEGANSKTVGETLMRKVSLLEAELDSAESNLRDTTEKLREMDVKAEHFERKAQQFENERDAFEKKHDELNEQYKQVKKELEDTLASLQDM
ncbi:hypothetical protein BG004_008037 [Podila humilis]|nr:hypothetical protein BG004_008037 [Podila humilis]